MTATDPYRTPGKHIVTALRVRFIGGILLAALLVASCADVSEDSESSAEEQFAAFESYYLVNGGGDPTSEDGLKALTALESAALDGHAEAQLNLGFMLSSGTILPENREMGDYWLLLSAQQDNLDAQRLVGAHFARRIHEPANDRFDSDAKTNAVYWLEKATEQGDLASQSLLSKLLVQNEETRERGLHLMKEAAELGDKNAIEGLELIDQLQQPESRSAKD